MLWYVHSFFPVLSIAELVTYTEQNRTNFIPNVYIEVQFTDTDINIIQRVMR